MNQREIQKNVWEKHWDKSHGNANEILSSQFTQKAYREIKRFIDNNDRYILEAGCGTARFCFLLAKDFPQAKVTGIDISDSALKIAEGAKLSLGVENVKFEKRDLFSTGYPDNFFDVVFNEGVIEHFSLNGEPTYEDAVREMVRITKRGGKVIIAVPNWYCFPHTIYKWVLHCLGRSFKYGYEKSFKQRELVALFQEFQLTEIGLSGWYPAYGFYRLSAHSKILALFGKVTDLIRSEAFQQRFGFETIVKGVKSS